MNLSRYVRQLAIIDFVIITFCFLFYNLNNLSLDPLLNYCLEGSSGATEFTT